MTKEHVFLMFVFILFNTSCKAPFNRAKREDAKCDGETYRNNHHAIHPGLLKTEYYAVNLNGDTIEIEYKKKKLNDILRYGILGYDTIIPLHTYKGKPFHGTTILFYYEYDEGNPISGCYRNQRTYANGRPVFSETYYPNGQLCSRTKGIFRGISSEVRINYDKNGRLLERQCKQAGLYFVNYVIQENSEYNGMGVLGYQMKLLDTTKAFEEVFVIERIVRNTGLERIQDKVFISNNTLEKIVFSNYLNNSGQTKLTSFQLSFYDYAGVQARSFSFARNKYNSDTVFRLHIEYLNYGGIKTLGQYFMNKKHGIWNYYHDDGTLKDVELYSEGRKHYSLHDENAYIYYHVLYDSTNGEVLQYKNDWIPDINPDSTFLYEFNQYEWSRHQRENRDFLNIWNINPNINKFNYLITDFIRSSLRKMFYADGRTKSIGFVTDKGEKTGVWIDFSHQGDTVSICDYYYGKPNGMYRKYINEVLVEKRDEIPDLRKDDPLFFHSIPYSTNKRKFFKRRAYWLRHWQEK